MVYESAVDKALKKKPEALSQLEYDYKELLEIKRKTRKGSKLNDAILTIEYKVKEQRNINLEIEMRRAILNHYSN